MGFGRFSRLVGLGVAFGGTAACTSILGGFEVGPTDTIASGDASDDVTVATDAGADGDAASPTTCGVGEKLVGGKCVTVCQPGGKECSGHGVCTDGPNGFTCKCDTEYGGPKCGVCAQGYQDDDNDGVCKPTCTTANLTCPAKATCSTVTGVANCTCTTGFTLDATPKCVWSGVVKDPTFQGTPANAWSVQPMNSTQIVFKTTDTAAGAHEPGFAVVTGAGLCASSGRPSINQTFDVPSPQDSGPLALTISSAATYASGTYYGQANIGTAGGGGTPFFWSVPATDTFTLNKFCLGEVAHGKARNLNVFMYGSGCPADPSASKGFIDFVSIAPDATCPAVGTVFNGDFEANGAGWTAAGTGGAGVLGGGGAGGTLGAVLTSKNDCDFSSLEGLISVPLPATTPNLALQFDFKGSGGGQSAQIRIDTGAGGGLVAANMFGGAAAFSPVSVCVPEWAKGQAGAITINMPQATTCSMPQPDSRQFSFDNFKLVTDMNCPAQSYIIDGDFERQAPGSPWYYDNSASGQIQGGVVANGANHYASLSATRYCNDGAARQTISVPTAANGFYKITFKYRTTESGQGAKFTVDVPGNNTVLPSTSGMWSTGVACINPAAGRQAMLAFHVQPKAAAGNCGDVLTTQTLDIDDVAGVLSMTCP